MFNITCDKCSSDLIIDVESTTSNYIKDDWKYAIDSDTGELIDESIQKYLVYKCRKCKSEYRFTYKEWEERYRKEIAMQVMLVRKNYAFKLLNPATIKADNGLEFCGQCPGYADDGYCLVDIIKQCSIRK